MKMKRRIKDREKSEVQCEKIAKEAFLPQVPLTIGKQLAYPQVPSNEP